MTLHDILDVALVLVAILAFPVSSFGVGVCWYALRAVRGMDRKDLNSGSCFIRETE